MQVQNATKQLDNKHRERNEWEAKKNMSKRFTAFELTRLQQMSSNIKFDCYVNDWSISTFLFLLALSPYFTPMDMRLLGWFLFLFVTFALLNSWCSNAIAADIDVFGIFAEQSRWKYFMHNVNNGFQQFRMTISNLCTYLFNSIRCKLYVVSLVENCSTIHSEDSGGWEEMSHITNSVSFAVPVGCILTTFTGYKHTVRYTTYEIHLSLRCRSQFQICQRQLATRQFSLMSTA